VFKSAWCLRHHLGFYPLVTYHAGSHGGETVKALTDGLTTLLLRENVVLLLFSIGEARAVVVVRSWLVMACGDELGIVGWYRRVWLVIVGGFRASL
jgi:hypothetical protein